MANLASTVGLQSRDIPKLTLLSKVSYGLGDFASNLSWTFIGSYFAIFLTDVAGIEVTIVSAMLLVTKIWDGINDPMFGAIAERTRSKYGRFRPWILYGCPFLAIANIICFTVPFQAAVMKVVWGVIGYLLVDAAYGAVNLSYGALSTVMTYDPKERTELNAWRMIGTNVGAVFLNLISMPLIIYFSGVGDGQSILPRGYTITTAIYAVVALPLFLLLFFTSREVVKPVEEKKVPIRETIKTVVTNKPLVCIFFMITVCLIAMFGRLGLSVYYYIYVLRRPDLIGPLMMMPSLVGAIVIFAFKGITDRIGKIRLIIISCIGGTISLLIIFFINPVDNITLLFVFTAIYGAFIGLATPLYLALVPDAIDYMEDKTGVRADGTSYTAVSLGTKISSAAGASIGLMILAAFGYVANAEQTSSSITGINIAVNLFPAICLVLTLIPTLLYPLTPEKNQAIRERLISKGSAGSGPAV
jgi:GPH family glycoside/pentoside/hexuronide:cation symporter/probable glucitol transport protein GutA